MKIISYLKQLFLEGEPGGKKYTALETVELMKRAKKVGNPQEFRFSVSEWLTEPQIQTSHSNLFSITIQTHCKVAYFLVFECLDIQEFADMQMQFFSTNCSKNSPILRLVPFQTG